MSDTDANPDPPIKNMKSQAPTCAKHEAEEFHRWLGGTSGARRAGVDRCSSQPGRGVGFQATG